MGFPLYYCDVHPGTGLYLPPGFQFWERIDKHADYVGTKSCAFLGSAGDQHPRESEALLSEIDTKLIMHNAQSKIVQIAMARLSTTTATGAGGGG
eukprot:4624718-Pyramimonas_sp.AAC.2